MDRLLSQQLRCSGLRDWSPEFRGYMGGYIGIMEKNMETTIGFRIYVRVWGLESRDTYGFRGRV